MTNKIIHSENELRTIPGLGVVQGVASEGTVAFRGIIYAMPPVGKLRFAPPQPAKPWQGIFDATKAGPIAPQLRSRADGVMGSIEAEQDEACLSLSIWMPAALAQGLPVMIWIHGGGFMSGGGSLPWYDGAAMAASQNVVVVSINYRIGVLGYLSIPKHLSGNLAILDQLLALQWVKNHIAAFGGDPNCITVMGESGGAHSIASLLTMKGTEGLFHRAIFQSAPLEIGLADQDASNLRTEAFLDALDLKAGDEDLPEKLRALSVEEILAAQAKAAVSVSKQIPLGDLRPPVLPTALPPHKLKGQDFSEAAARNAAERGVDVMIGWTRDEANMFFADAQFGDSLKSADVERLGACLWGEIAPQLLSEQGQPKLSPAERFAKAITDFNFRLPSSRFAELVTRFGGRAFVYQFDWCSPSPGLGACHCLDIPFMLGTWRAWTDAPILKGADQTKVEALSRDMMHRWATFARTGNPEFPPWGASRRPVMHFNNECWLENENPLPSDGQAALRRL